MCASISFSVYLFSFISIEFVSGVNSKICLTDNYYRKKLSYDSFLINFHINFLFLWNFYLFHYYIRVYTPFIFVYGEQILKEGHSAEVFETGTGFSSSVK